MSHALVKAEPYQDMPGYAPPLFWFLRRRVIGRAGARLDWADIYREFVTPDWHNPPSPRAVASALAWLCSEWGVRVDVIGRNVYCLDCAWG
jgi:hypothetical protein